MFATGQFRPVVFFVTTAGMRAHEFQHVARQFRAGKISLHEFTEKVFAGKTPNDSPIDSVVPGLLEKLLARKADSHKGDYGRLLVVAGSPGMAGAAALTGLAALRCGSGLVTVATDQRCRSTVASFHPSLMTVGLFPDTGSTPRSYSELQEMVPHHDCVAIGPGLGTSEAAARLVDSIVKNAQVPGGRRCGRVELSRPSLRFLECRGPAGANAAPW